MRLRLIWIYLLALATALAVANIAASLWRVQGKEPPEYATWTGVLEVERKVGLLRDFAREGDVDVLILSSSMGDYGISAETLTREISAAKGRPFRVFNFSMGGADLTSYPLLYRFARVVARPKEIWIVSPVSTSPIQGEGSLDDLLLKGPVGRALKLPWLLPLEYAFRDLPLVRNAAAIRDWAVYRGFPNRAKSNLDLYEINRHGDTRSWLYNPKEYENGLKHMERHIDHVMKFVRQPNAVEDQKHHVLYFSTPVMGAVNDLRALASADGASITVVPFDSAVSLAIHDPAFLAASQRFYGPLSQYLGARLLDVRTSFESKPYMITDPIHMNCIGSEQFSKVLAAAVTGRPAPPHVELVADERIRKTSPDPAWTTFTALVVKRRDEPSGSLRVKYFQSWGVKRLRPFSNFRIAVRLPDGRESVLPTRVMQDGEVVADTSGLDFASVDQVITAQLVNKGEKMGKGMDVPVVSYRWSAERMPPAWYEEGAPAVQAAAASYSTGGSIDVAWRNLSEPEKHDWIGLFPEGGDGASRVSFAYTHGKVEGTTVLPAVGRAGRFELRLFRNDGWESIATSPPIVVSESTGSVAVGEATVTAGHAVPVTWSGLNNPHKQDWIGLFPKGAKDDARRDFRYTGGAKEGSLQIPVAEDTPPGEYELRLFSSGGWTRLGTSATFTIVVPPAAAAAAK